jgi:hypothetical protein
MTACAIIRNRAARDLGKGNDVRFDIRIEVHPPQCHRTLLDDTSFFNPLHRTPPLFG